MWFECKCGTRIHDNSDFQYNKAHLIPDKLWDGFWCDIDEAIEKSGPTPKQKEETCMNLRYKQYSRLMYQCPNCGRIFISDKNNELRVYKPEPEDFVEGVLDAT